MAALLWGLLGAMSDQPLAQSRTPQTPTRQLEQTLQQHVGVQWQHVPLRPALERLASVHGIAVFLDRRLDPDQAITSAGPHETLESLLRQIAEPIGADVRVIGPVVYLGPQRHASDFATHYSLQCQELAQLPPRIQRRWLERQPAQWSEFSQPKELIDQWLSAAEVSAVGLELVPHDLWPSCDLPPLDLLQRLTITLAGFDLAPVIEPNGNVQIRSLPTGQQVRSNYELANRAQIDVIAQSLPAESYRVAGRTLIVEGDDDLHQIVKRLLRQPSRGVATRTPRMSTQEKRFTLTVQNQPVAAVLNAVATQAGLLVQWKNTSPQRQQQRVSVKVNDVTLERLLAAICAAAELQFQLVDRDGGQALLISPR